MPETAGNVMSMHHRACSTLSLGSPGTGLFRSRCRAEGPVSGRRGGRQIAGCLSHRKGLGSRAIREVVASKQALSEEEPVRTALMGPWKAVKNLSRHWARLKPMQER